MRIYMDKFIVAFYIVLGVLTLLMGMFYYSALDIKKPEGFLEFTKALFGLIMLTIFIFMITTTNKLDRINMKSTK